MSDIVKIKDKEFQTLVAITPEDHSTGLMYKSWPPPVMCFPYNNAAVRKFWMKNTISPLDIVFCNKGKIISICFGEPLSTKMVGPDRPSDLVIEFPAGTTKTFGFGIGDEVNLALSKQTIAKSIGSTFLAFKRG
jgi:uncharacterized membrane protein (UPF0127 family)